MKLKPFLILISQFLLVFSEVCFDGLGCFDQSNLTGKSIERYFFPLPNNPSLIDTKFYLYNRKINNSEVISFDSLTESYLIKTPTKFIIHGFLQNSSRPWSINMKNEILNKENVNVIIVDWSKGSFFPYEQAVSNAHVVGAEIARLINSLINNNRTSARQFHLIGMSLGAHIAGYAGKRVAGLGRITGLDPAGPYFENAEDEIRLAKSDANFVDVIHTDIPSYLNFGLGISKSIGHVDFFVNGGFDQPNCAKKSEQLASMLFILAMKNFQKARHLITCSHLSAIDYFIDSIKDSCRYTAFRCSSKSEFDNGKCFNCSNKGCNQMGYWASLDNDLGNLFLNTKPASDKRNLCKLNYLITLRSQNNSDSQIRAYGKFSIIFGSSGRNSSEEIIDDSNIIFKPNLVESRLISTSDLDEIINLYIVYQKTQSLINWIYEDSWQFEQIDLLDQSGSVNKFCPYFTENKTQQMITKFKKC